MARVLLIEDDPDTGESLRAMLETEHEVIWAHHGKEALAFLGQEPRPDLVLTDILMPEMDGLESIQYLRRNHPDIPIVAMTAQRQTPYLRAASHFGAQATLYKPFGLQKLRETIQSLLAPA